MRKVTICRLCGVFFLSVRREQGSFQLFYILGRRWNSSFFSGLFWGEISTLMYLFYQWFLFVHSSFLFLFPCGFFWKLYSSTITLRSRAYLNYFAHMEYQVFPSHWCKGFSFCHSIALLPCSKLSSQYVAPSLHSCIRSEKRAIHPGCNFFTRHLEKPCYSPFRMLVRMCGTMWVMRPVGEPRVLGWWDTDTCRGAAVGQRPSPSATRVGPGPPPLASRHSLEGKRQTHTCWLVPGPLWKCLPHHGLDRCGSAESLCVCLASEDSPAAGKERPVAGSLCPCY